MNQWFVKSVDFAKINFGWKIETNKQKVIFINFSISEINIEKIEYILDRFIMCMNLKSK